MNVAQLEKRSRRRKECCFSRLPPRDCISFLQLDLQTTKQKSPPSHKNESSCTFASCFFLSNLQQGRAHFRILECRSERRASTIDIVFWDFVRCFVVQVNHCTPENSNFLTLKLSSELSQKVLLWAPVQKQASFDLWKAMTFTRLRNRGKLWNKRPPTFLPVAFYLTI